MVNRSGDDERTWRTRLDDGRVVVLAEPSAGCRPDGGGTAGPSETSSFRSEVTGTVLSREALGEWPGYADGDF